MAPETGDSTRKVAVDAETRSRNHRANSLPRSTRQVGSSTRHGGVSLPLIAILPRQRDVKPYVDRQASQSFRHINATGILGLLEVFTLFLGQVAKVSSRCQGGTGGEEEAPSHRAFKKRWHLALREQGTTLVIAACIVTNPNQVSAGSATPWRASGVFAGSVSKHGERTLTAASVSTTPLHRPRRQPVSSVKAPNQRE